MKRTTAGLAVIAGASLLAVASLQACGGGSSGADGDDDERDGSMLPGRDATTGDGGGDDGSSDASSADSASDGAGEGGEGGDIGDTGPTGIPAVFFGQHVGQLGSFPVKVPYGAYRVWDTPSQWETVETCDPTGAGGATCFQWGAFDQQMTAVKADGVDEVLFTLSRTPSWAVPADAGAPSTPCDYEGTTCYPPRGLAADGSGPDDIWIGWVTALGQHANAPGYAATHAHVHIYEPWNEFYRSPMLTASGWNTTSVQGTYAQLVRMTEDLRCVIKGVGTLHNYPAAGDATACATFLATRNQTAIDPDALIATPSGEYNAAGSSALRAMQNFLYCSADASAASGCTTGSAGSEAVDIINLHLYPETILPETALGTFVPAAKAILSPADLAKPLISGEGSWGLVTLGGSLWEHDAYERAGFIPRYFALGWSAGLEQLFWYAYDNGGWGQLYSHPSDGGAGSLKSEESAAWDTTHAWLLGAVSGAADGAPFCQASGTNGTSGTVYTCDFLQKGTVPSRLVWDSSFSPAAIDGGHGCLAYSDPWICGTGRYTSVAGFSTVQELSGATATPISGGSVTIGANPVLLQ